MKYFRNTSWNGSRRLPDLVLSSYKLERSWGITKIGQEKLKLYFIMKTSLLLILLFCVNAANAQDKFEYFFSEEVTQSITEYLIEEKNDVDISEFYIKLVSTDYDEYSLYILRNLDSYDQTIKNLIDLSNRYIVISDQRIPIIFQEDYYFGVFGRDELGIKRTIMIGHGFHININLRGKIIE